MCDGLEGRARFEEGRTYINQTERPGVWVGSLVGRLRTRAAQGRTKYCPKFWNEESKSVLSRSHQDEVGLIHSMRGKG